VYSVGDKVVHPDRGPGVITGVELRQIVGQAKRYYVIDLLVGGATLFTPVARAEEVGLRPAIDDASWERLFNLLSERPSALPPDFRERQTKVDERLKTNDVFTAAGVIRDMTWHGQVHNLTKRDTELLQRAEELVAGELALVLEIEIKEATERVRTIVAQAEEP
jgi:CarD family transcriptional regulator